jgi:hypothetical protein
VEDNYGTDGFTPFISVNTEQSPSNITIKLSISNELPEELENYNNLIWEFRIRLHETSDPTTIQSGFKAFIKYFGTNEMSLNANREYVFVSPTLEVNERGKFFDIFIVITGSNRSPIYYKVDQNDNRQRHKCDLCRIISPY